MSDQHAWPSRALAERILADVAGTRAQLAGMAHSFAGDEVRLTQAALVEAVGLLDVLAETLQARLCGGVALGAAAVPESRPGREPGQSTVERRFESNRGNAKHRAKP